jgi:hypothetical protein
MKMKTQNRLLPLTEAEINEIQGIAILTETDVADVSGGGFKPSPEFWRWVGNTVASAAAGIGLQKISDSLSSPGCTGTGCSNNSSNPTNCPSIDYTGHDAEINGFV